MLKNKLMYGKQTKLKNRGRPEEQSMVIGVSSPQSVMSYKLLLPLDFQNAN